MMRGEHRWAIRKAVRDMIDTRNVEGSNARRCDGRLHCASVRTQFTE
jgi:hypothetical protein